ncbi:guanylate kinase [Trypanosoma cruzi Dm28c]|uniref:Guanylate kinase n=1 Tax=Trypanosoma cruzi Dm28c TaxID=1416333 RepID=V5BBU2_TRYCR|nr:guanylate kinase [Trypanosoma cruzi Dm28c]PBJ67876.1 guanylate kinase [Trypanosoma cruzi cruzi]
MQHQTDILIFIGPSGGGKSTLIAYLMQTWPQQFSFCTSHTTRKPRWGEVEGKDYHFVSRDEFKLMIHGDMFVEYNRVFSSFRQEDGASSCAGGSGGSSPIASAEDDVDYYGTSKEELHRILSEKKVVVLDTDITGAINVKKYCSQLTNSGNGAQAAPLRVKVILVKIPSLDVLKHRLRLRGSESDASLQKRLHAGQRCLEWCAAHPEFFQCVLVNNSLDACQKELRSFVMRSVLKVDSML